MWCARRLDELWGLALAMEVEQSREEMKKLVQHLACIRPKRIMEIGTAKGGTLFLWGKIFDPDLLISIDLPNGMYGGIGTENDERYKTFGRDVRLLRKDSHDMKTWNEAAGMVGEKMLDFLFIDGDHTYDGVRYDFEMYRPLVRPGGLIAMHDIMTHDPKYNCQVDEFWKLVKRTYKTFEIIADKKQKFYGIGVMVVEG
jgi:predicted O-methyltransferase YrrM